MNVRMIGTYDPTEKKLRLLRLTWTHGTVGAGGASHVMSLGLVPRIMGWSHTYRDWRLTVCGVVVRYAQSHGGTFA